MTSTNPSPDCPLCPRLHDFIAEWRRREPDWFNAPVPTFSAAAGDGSVELLIVGLAPGLRGANRTGRPFTGDYAGELLYSTLSRFGFSHGTFRARPDDGVELVGAALTNAVRCVPPENKPTGAEIATCRRFLAATIARFPNLRAILALGTVAHQSTVRALGLRVPGILAQDIGVDEIRLVPGHVVKPTAGGNSKGVFSVEADGSVFDVGENERISADEAMQRIRAFDQARKSKRIAWNIEERISGPDGRSPVDLKFYAFYGELPIVTEVQRQPFKAFNNYLANGEKISTGKFDGMTFDGMAPTAEEYAVARKVSLAIKVPFLRIDFMRAGNGELVFCEFTPRPGNFDKHNSLVDRLCGRYFVEAEARLLAEFLR